MELKDLLVPVSCTLQTRNSNSKISFCVTQNLDDIKNCKPHAIVLGYTEYRNSNTEPSIKIADIFREFLSQLYETSQNITIVDVGNCIQGKTIRESYIILQEVLKIIKELHVPILIIGGTHEAVYYIGKETLKKIPYPTISIIDSKIDLELDNEDFSHTNYIQKLHSLSDSIRLISIGYQEYLSSNKTYEWFKTLYYPLFRLGKVRQNLVLTEPLIRDAHIVSFDASAIRNSDMPSHVLPNPNGLYAEEACQLAWYAGYSQNLNVFFMSDCFIQDNSKHISASLVSEIIWHVLDGISQQKVKTVDFSAEKYTRYYVRNTFLDQDITFYENILTQQMWVEIPIKNKRKKRVIPCSVLDYQDFLNNNLSENWLLEFNRLYNK